MSTIINKYKANEVMEGAGVLVNRAFSYNETKEFDPFLMLDYFSSDEDMDSPGFPWHPHKGIETITYFLRGSGQHEDSMGNKGIIDEGELQWMSAGKGIYHQEMQGETPNGVEGFQFWVNLHKSKKLKTPEYKYIKKGEMKTVKENGVTIKVISGRYGNTIGPIDKSELGIEMLHVLIDNNHSIVLNIAEDKQGFIFLFHGSGTIDGDKVISRTAYTLGSGDIIINADDDKDMEFIYAQGIPLKESIAWQGPIVMNTQEELYKTFRDLSEGTFIE